MRRVLVRNMHLVHLGSSLVNPITPWWSPLHGDGRALLLLWHLVGRVALHLGRWHALVCLLLRWRGVVLLLLWRRRSIALLLLMSWWGSISLLLLLLLLRWWRTISLLLLVLLLLLVGVSQLADEVIALHLPGQAKIPALHLEGIDGILQRGVKADTLLKVFLDLLVDFVRVLDLDSKSAALGLVLPDVVHRKELLVLLDQLCDEAFLELDVLSHRVLQRLVLEKLVVEYLLLRVRGRHQLRQNVVLELGLVELVLQEGPLSRAAVQFTEALLELVRGCLWVTSSDRDHGLAQVRSLCTEVLVLQEQDRVLWLLQLLQGALVAIPRRLNLRPEIRYAGLEGSSQSGGGRDDPLLLVPVSLGLVLVGLGLQLLLSAVEHLCTNVPQSLELLRQLEAVLHSAVRVHLGNLLSQGFREDGGEVAAVRWVQGHQNLGKFEFLQLGPRHVGAGVQLALLLLYQRVNQLGVLGDHLGARVRNKAYEHVPGHLVQVARLHCFDHASLRYRRDLLVGGDALQVNALVVPHSFCQLVVAGLGEVLRRLHDEIVGVLTGFLPLLDLQVSVPKPRDSGTDVALVLLLLRLCHQHLGLCRKVEDLAPQVVEPGLLHVVVQSAPRDDGHDLAVEDHTLLPKPGTHAL
mmetsp:Transcript_4724/g.14092  ORF Transcript_4724/g.14092 Transcript_4724/m.14092 type:complete len:634 (-) Transcript_4724:1137-3038(-)